MYLYTILNWDDQEPAVMPFAFIVHKEDGFIAVNVVFDTVKRVSKFGLFGCFK